MKRKFKVLYTHQKLKKRKTWQDGLLTLREDQRRGFLGDDANKQLATVFLNKKKVANGDELECDKYLIQVEDEVLNEIEQNDKFEKEELLLSSPACVRVQDPSAVGQVRRKFTVPRQKEVVCVAPVEQIQPHEKEIMTSPSIWSSVDDGIGEGIRTIQSVEKTSSDCSRSSSTVRGTDDLLKLLSGKVANPVINKESEHVSDLSSNDVFPSEDHGMFSTAKNLVEFKSKCLQPETRSASDNYEKAQVSETNVSEWNERCHVRRARCEKSIESGSTCDSPVIRSESHCAMTSNMSKCVNDLAVRECLKYLLDKVEEAEMNRETIADVDLIGEEGNPGFIATACDVGVNVEHDPQSSTDDSNCKISSGENVTTQWDRYTCDNVPVACIGTTQVETSCSSMDYKDVFTPGPNGSTDASFGSKFLNFEEDLEFEITNKIDNLNRLNDDDKSAATVSHSGSSQDETTKSCLGTQHFTESQGSFSLDEKVDFVPPNFDIGASQFVGSPELSLEDNELRSSNQEEEESKNADAYECHHVPVDILYDIPFAQNEKKASIVCGFDQSEAHLKGAGDIGSNLHVMMRESFSPQHLSTDCCQPAAMVSDTLNESITFSPLRSSQCSCDDLSLSGILRDHPTPQHREIASCDQEVPSRFDDYANDEGALLLQACMSLESNLNSTCYKGVKNNLNIHEKSATRQRNESTTVNKSQLVPGCGVSCAETSITPGSPRPYDQAICQVNSLLAKTQSAGCSNLEKTVIYNKLDDDPFLGKLPKPTSFHADTTSDRNFNPESPIPSVPGKVAKSSSPTYQSITEALRKKFVCNNKRMRPVVDPVKSKLTDEEAIIKMGGICSQFATSDGVVLKNNFPLQTLTPGLNKPPSFDLDFGKHNLSFSRTENLMINSPARQRSRKLSDMSKLEAFISDVNPVSKWGKYNDVTSSNLHPSSFISAFEADQLAGLGPYSDLTNNLGNTHDFYRNYGRDDENNLCVDTGATSSQRSFENFLQKYKEDTSRPLELSFFHDATANEIHSDVYGIDAHESMSCPFSTTQIPITRSELEKFNDGFRDCSSKWVKYENDDQYVPKNKQLRQKWLDDVIRNERRQSRRSHFQEPSTQSRLFEEESMLQTPHYTDKFSEYSSNLSLSDNSQVFY